MYLKLPSEWVERLQRLPESGMGYQVVDLDLEGGRRLRGVPVFNGEEIFVPESREFDVSEISRIELHDDPGSAN